MGEGGEAGQLIIFCLLLPAKRVYLALEESMFDNTAARQCTSVVAELVLSSKTEQRSEWAQEHNIGRKGYFAIWEKQKGGDGSSKAFTQQDIVFLGWNRNHLFVSDCHS